MSSTLGRIASALRSLARGTTKGGRARRRGSADSRGRHQTRRQHASEARPAAYVPYRGDATTLPDMTYAADPDGAPDPGEIVWSWVPYEEDHTRGKDLPSSSSATRGMC
jgi:hypothetical protein